MLKLMHFIRSIASPDRSEEIYLLSRHNSSPVVDSLYDFNEMTVDNHFSYQNTDSNNIRSSSGDDFNCYSEKSKSNRINEYQAAWNVTNAIQVNK